MSKTYSNNNNNNKTVITPHPPPNNIPRSNGTQACAACKYQRRKCAHDCILAPYFPHDRQRQFLNAHKLFGVSNITKLIRSLNQPSDRDQAMRTIIFQSDVRANDPVGGCYRIIRELQRQIEYSRAELQIVLHQLAICRAQNQTTQMLLVEEANNNGAAVQDPLISCSFDVMNNYNDNANHSNLHHEFDDDLQQPQQQDDQQHYFLQQINDDDHVVPLQHEINSWAALAMHNSTLPALQVKQPVVDVEEDIVKPLLDDISDQPIRDDSSRSQSAANVQQPI